MTADPLRIYRSALACIEPDAQVGWLAGRMGITQAVARELLGSLKLPAAMAAAVEKPKLPEAAEAAATSTARRRILTALLEARKHIGKDEIIFRAAVSEDSFKKNMPGFVRGGLVYKRRNSDCSVTFALRGIPLIGQKSYDAEAGASGSLRKGMQALGMREYGFTFEEIAERMHVSTASVRKYCQLARKAQLDGEA